MMAESTLQPCRRCFGRGYVGRWRRQTYGPKWKLETCQGCGGRGEREYAPRKKKVRDAR